QRLASWRNQRLLEGDALVARQHRLAKAGQSVAIADRRRDVRHFVAARFSLLRRAAKSLERLEEERLDVVGLETARLSALHVLADTVHAAQVHHVVSEGALLEEILDLRSVEGVGDILGEARAHFRLLAVPDRLDQQLAQRATLELQPAEHIEDLTTERVARLLELLEEQAVDVALARLIRHQV